MRNMAVALASGAAMRHYQASAAVNIASPR
jgi:hypothetical protein